MTVLSKQYKINKFNNSKTKVDLVYYVNPSIFKLKNINLYLHEKTIFSKELNSKKIYSITECQEIASVKIKDDGGYVYTYIILSVGGKLFNSEGNPYIIWLSTKKTSHLNVINKIIKSKLIDTTSFNFELDEDIQFSLCQEPKSWPVMLRPKQKDQISYTDMDGVVIGLNIPKDAPGGVRNMKCARKAKLTSFGFVMLLAFDKISIITNRRGEKVEKELKETLKKSIEDDFYTKSKDLGIHNIGIDITFSFEPTHGPENRWKAIQPIKGISKMNRLKKLTGSLKDFSFSEDQPHVVKDLLQNGVNTVIHVHKNTEKYSIIHNCNMNTFNDKENFKVSNNILINDTA